MPATLATNKSLRSYDILDKIEAGIVLTGAETKSAKAAQINLKGAYVAFQKDEPYLINAHITRYKPAGAQPEYDPKRPRKLLLNKKEIASLTGKSREKGLTIMPSRVYIKRNRIKVQIVVARGVKKHDRRNKIKKDEADRNIQRAMRRKR